ncbi:MAG: S8 family serine peptidase [Planctomycetes bacterium]|nr:S8 family serine peptidase [Planctomycetota bacterium]
MSSGLLDALGLGADDLLRRDLAPVEVAVLDSGIDATHPDLAGRVAAAYRIELQDDSPRAVEAPVGENTDDFGHGTGVASIIARLAPNARLVDVRVLDASSLGRGIVLLEGLRQAIRRRSRVINMSLAASSEFRPQLLALCEEAYRANQIVVAARRNMPLSDNGFPAENSSCIGVDRENLPSPYRVLYRRDCPIEYVAHGDDVVVAEPGGGHAVQTGTSFATPAASALCAVVLGAFPDLVPFEVKTVLKAMADRDSAGTG